jgi:hypothetical protein
VSVAVAGAILFLTRIDALSALELLLLGDFVGRLLEERLDVLSTSHKYRRVDPRMR